MAIDKLLALNVTIGASLTASGPDAPSLYVEWHIDSEIDHVRSDAMAVAHHLSPTGLPLLRRAAVAGVPHGELPRLREAWSQRAERPALFEIRNHARPASDLRLRNPEVGAQLARTLGSEGSIVLITGNGTRR